MADIELRAVDGTTILVQAARNPSYPWPQSYQSNLDVSRAVGGAARSSRLGQSLLVNRPTWRQLDAAAASQLLEALRDYAGGALPLVLHLAGSFEQVADNTRAADGTLYATGDFRCRIYDDPEVVHAGYDTYEVTLPLTQDL